jgi:hypothetical protein
MLSLSQKNRKEVNDMPKPIKTTAPDMRKTENKAKYGSVTNRDATAPRGKANPANTPKKGK